MPYAEGTTVTVEKTQADILALLRKYGASNWGVISEQQTAAIIFTAHARRIQFTIKLPDPGERRWQTTPSGRKRDATAAAEQEVRRLWRCLLLALRAKLEVVESGIATFEEEFLAHIVTPDGRPFYEHAKPALERAYADGAPPQLDVPTGGVSTRLALPAGPS